jgi:hypothetical protein
MDTKRLEQIGETFVISSLLGAGILVAKPFFDQLGTDLVGFTSVDDKARLCPVPLPQGKESDRPFLFFA